MQIKCFLNDQRIFEKSGQEMIFLSLVFKNFAKNDITFEKFKRAISTVNQFNLV